MRNLEALDAGYRECARLTRRHGTTYYWGTAVLPRAQRRHVHAVYALCRLADDIVDEPDAGARSTTATQSTADRLAAFVERFRTALAGGPVPDPVLLAVRDTVETCAIDPACFDRFFAAMSMDLTVCTYETFADLCAYMDGSAAVIGEMMLPVLAPGDAGAAATASARSLGLAFQLTNFLRDVAEDLDRGRVYLPQQELREFGVDIEARRVTPAWRSLMAFQLRRARELYAHADEGVGLLPPRSGRCIVTARTLYAGILDRIEAADYDVFTTRVRVRTSIKAATAARMMVPRQPRPKEQGVCR